MAFGATKLVGVLAKEASEEKLAIGRMREDRMGLKQSLRPNGFLARTSKTFDRFEVRWVFANSGLWRQLCVADAGPDGHIEVQGGHARHLVGRALIAEVKLLALLQKSLLPTKNREGEVV